MEHHLQILPDAGGIPAGKGAHLQVFQHGHLTEDPAALRHLGQTPHQDLVGGMPGDVHPVKADLSAFGAQQARDGLENGGLAGAVGSDQRADLAVPHLKAHTLDRMDLIIIYIQFLDFEHLAFNLPDRLR